MSESKSGQIARATVIDVPMSGQRSLATVTAEIRAYQDAARRMVVEYSIEIGRRLVEAKSMVKHGEWGAYLKDELGLSQSSANNHMRNFEAYSAQQMTLDGAAVKHQAFADLSYTQALALLALPSEEERVAFVESHDMEGISTRELQAEIARLQAEKDAADKQCLSLQKERDAAEDRARCAETSEDAALQERDRAKKSEDSLRKAVDALKQERKKDAGNVEKFKAQANEAANRQHEAEKKASALQEELEAARRDPKIPEAVLEKIRDEAEEAALRAAQAKADKEAADRLAAVQEQLAAAQKALKLASPEMAVFKERFERVQKDLMALIRSVDGLPENLRGGAWKALAALIVTAKSECAGVDQ